MRRRSSIRTYAALLREAEARLRAGRATVLDATYLLRAPRAEVRALAAKFAAPFAIVHVDVNSALARSRIEARAVRDDDPSDATVQVYENQVATAEPFTPEELPFVVRHDGSKAPEDVLGPLLERLASPRPR